MVLVWSLGAVLAGVVVLAVPVSAALAPARRFRAARADAAGVVPRVRTLTARAGALRVRSGAPRVASAVDDREGISS